ncbi:MAG: hypothetical protein ACR2LF_09165 [Jatrophihabitantaceae bacterium]
MRLSAAREHESSPPAAMLANSVVTGARPASGQTTKQSLKLIHELPGFVEAERAGDQVLVFDGLCVQASQKRPAARSRIDSDAAVAGI